MKVRMKLLVIGDVHFKSVGVKDEKYFDTIIHSLETLVRDEKGDVCVIVLGDILHTFKNVDSACQNLATDFLFELSTLATTFVLIGNHDFHDKSSAYSTSNKHSLYPISRTAEILGEWEGETFDLEEVEYTSPCIINKVTTIFYKNLSFTLCPYVSEGTFIESLDSSVELTCEDWRESDMVFGHVEIKGSKLAEGHLSNNSDIWDKSYPPLVSGHIHHSHTITSGRVFYTGSSRQTSHADDHEKSIWVIDLDDEDAWSCKARDEDPIRKHIDSCYDFNYITEIKLKGVPGMIKVVYNTLPDEMSKENMFEGSKQDLIEYITCSVCEVGHHLRLELVGTKGSIRLFLYDHDVVESGVLGMSGVKTIIILYNIQPMMKKTMKKRMKVRCFVERMKVLRLLRQLHSNLFF